MSMDTSTAKSSPLSIHIRWMIRRDMPEVLEIEHGSYDNPWSEEEFLRTLRQRNCIGMVAEAGERVLGFMIYELHKNKLNILNLTVHSEFRRQGIGTQMIDKLKAKLSAHRRTRLVVAAKHDDSQATGFLLHCQMASTEPDITLAPPELVDAYTQARRLFKKAKRKLREERAKLKAALGDSEFELVSASSNANSSEIQYYQFTLTAQGLESPAEIQPLSVHLPEAC